MGDRLRPATQINLIHYQSRMHGNIDYRCVWYEPEIQNEDPTSCVLPSHPAVGIVGFMFEIIYEHSQLGGNLLSLGIIKIKWFGKR